MPDHSFLAAFQRESCNPLQDRKYNGSVQKIWHSKIEFLLMVLILPLKVLKYILSIFATLLKKILMQIRISSKSSLKLTHFLKRYGDSNLHIFS